MRRGTALVALALVLALGGLVALAISVPWASSTGSASPDSSLTCSVKASCTGSEVEVFRMSSLANAHAGTPGGSTYGNKVCCGGETGLGTSCSGVYDTVLALSDTDNAHAATTVGGAYTTEVCLSVTTGTVDCTHAATCGAGFACLATISGTTNAHVADCDGVDDYATKVCCSVEATPTPTPTPTPCPDSDGDGYDDCLEAFLGTDPAKACPVTSTPNDEEPDAWPPDFDDNQTVNILDFLQLTPPVFNTSPPDPNYSQRKDLNGDGTIDILDFLKLTPPVFNTSCTP